MSLFKCFKYQISQLKKRQFSVGLAILLIGMLNSVQAQDRQLLNGQIRADSLSGVPVDIVNITAKSGTASRADGSFSIKAAPGDSILISALVYQPYYLKVTEGLLARKTVEIPLQHKANRLSEVNISANGLSGDLHKDAATIPDDYFDQAKIGFPKKKQLTVAERHLYTATASAAGAGLLLVPVDALINAISGRTKMLKRQVAYEHTEKKRDKVLKLLSESFFTKELSLTKDQMNRLIYAGLDSEKFLSFLRAKDVLKMMDYYRKRANDFKPTREKNDRFSD